MDEKAIEEYVLKVVDDRPQTTANLSVLLNVPIQEARKIVSNILRRKLASPMSSMRSRISRVGNAEISVDDNDPLTLTFRGYMRLHPLFTSKKEG